MVRETRHLWVGNLPDNIREDRIREHFKRYGRVQSVKLLARSSSLSGSIGNKEETSSEGTTSCTVAFMDIKSASKAHNAEHKLDDRLLTTEYYEPAAIPSSASPQNTPSSYSTSSPSTTSRFPNGHGSSNEDHVNFSTERSFYERSNSNRVTTVNSNSSNSGATITGPDVDYIRRTSSSSSSSSSTPAYHDNCRSRNRDRSTSYRNGPSSYIIDTNRSHRTTGGNTWSSYESTTQAGANTPRSYTQNDTGYSTTPITTPSSDVVKKKTKSKSRTPSPAPTIGSRTPRSRSRSHSSSSSSSSSTSRDDASSNSEKRPVAICVKNLPPRSSDTSLKDGLFHEYKKHGKVTWVKVVGQGSDRYAIVCFKKPEDVEKALEVSYDKLFFGCKIEVEPYQGYDVEDNDLRPYEAEIDEYHPKATRTLFIGNLEKDVTASDLRKHFDAFGEIIEIDIKKQGAVGSYAFCQYSDIVSVVKAIRAMDGEHLGNNRIKLGFGKSMPTNCVWVDGVLDLNEKYLRMHFEQYGSIAKIHTDRDKGQALVFYDQVSSAQVAVNKMRGFTIKGAKIQVDFASRECQESFFEHLDKQTATMERTNIDERTTASATTKFINRYETPTRPRTTSYTSSSLSRSSTSGGCGGGGGGGSGSSGSGVGGGGCSGGGGVSQPAAMPSPGTPGSVTPHRIGVGGVAGVGPSSNTSTSSRRLGRFPPDYYDAGNEYPHYRNYDEYSQGSGASHDETYDMHDTYGYPSCSPHHVDHLIDQRIVPNQIDSVPFAQPELRNLQKERVHLLEQLEECPSSGDELHAPKKRFKLDLLDGSASDVIIEANRDHRKVMEVRRLSDPSLKHHPRRPSIDKHLHYLPHSVCKRRKTGGSDGSRGGSGHHYEHSGSESVGGSRPGTPLVDERPEHFPSEPRRVPRERDGILSLPLPKFAAQFRGSVGLSVSGIKGPSPVITSPKISTPKPPSPVHVPPPASPPPRPPSLSSNSSDSDVTPPSPSLDERIKSLEEKYEKWSGSRALSAAGGEALAKLDATREKFRLRHNLLDLDLKEVQPSEIVKSVMAKRSVFDEDLKRLENVGEKYEPKDFSSTFTRTVGSATVVANSVTTTTTTAPMTIPTSTIVAGGTAPATLGTLLIPAVLKNIPLTPAPKTPTTVVSPRSTGVNIPAAKGLQYPFPTHPPITTTPTPPATTTTCSSSSTSTTSSSTSNPTTPLLTTSTITTRVTASTHSAGDSRLKPCSVIGQTPSDNNTRTLSKVTNVNSNKSSCSSSSSSGNNVILSPPPPLPVQTLKTSEKANNNNTVAPNNNNNIPHAESKSRPVAGSCSEKSVSDKVSSRRDSNSSSPRTSDSAKTRRNSDARKPENDDHLEKERLDKERVEREKLEREAEVEKERLEKERRDKQREEELKQQQQQQQQLRHEEEKKQQDNHDKHRHRERDSNHVSSTETKTKESENCRKESNNTSHRHNKDSVKENRDNNVHEKKIESRHSSLDYERSKIDPNKRKERSSLPGSLGVKRRLSSQSAEGLPEESKKIKLSSHDSSHKRERRDSKDSNRSEDKSKKQHKNNVKSSSGYDRDKHREERHKKQKLEKHRKKDRDSSSTPKELSDKDFLARLDLRSNEDIQKQKKKDSDDCKKKHSSSDGNGSKPKCEDRNRKPRERVRKLTQNSSDNNSDSDEPKKHSIFDIVDDEPAYISMYDKVKARSCKNMQKQEEEKRQEKIKAKFSQLKQSRAKREEKKRSTSWDEDSDSDRDKHDIKTKRNKMLIMSSDEEESACNVHKKCEIYNTDSDSDHGKIKSEVAAGSSEEDRIKIKRSKSRIASDSSEDEIKQIQKQIKAEIFSDNDVDQGFADSEEKSYKIKKERKQRADEDIFGEFSTPTPLLDVKPERYNNRFADVSSADEDVKKEQRKKHKKKQKRTKHSLSGEENTKTEAEESSKHHEKKKQHSKKDKRRDKTKEERDKSKKSKKNRAEMKTTRDGKMENIFGSLSEDSERENKDKDEKIDTFLEHRFESSFVSGGETDHETKDEHKKRKEKKRRGKERRLEEQNNENSMDYADMAKQLEANIKDDSSEEIVKHEENKPNDETFRLNEKEERKEPREKKKKRKKSKEEKQKHHHHHHKSSRKEEENGDNKSLPTFDVPSPPTQAKTESHSDLTETLQSPVSKQSPPANKDKDKKRDKFIPGFGAEIDEKIHENAIKSISEFANSEKLDEIVESADDANAAAAEKPRVVISQEETEDAVAALLGESFTTCEESYNEESQNEQSSNLEDSLQQQDDEEMRQAVQSLSATDIIEAKPDTPQSEHDLQIDTDTEEDTSLNIDQPPKTPDIARPKTPELNYFRSSEIAKEPPSLSPIKQETKPVVEEVKTPQSLSLPTLPEQNRTVISPNWSAQQDSKEVKDSKPVVRTYGVKLPEANYPPLTPVSKPEAVPITNTINRLPITPVMISKPLQPTTVVLPNPKVARSLEPPILVSTEPKVSPPPPQRSVVQNMIMPHITPPPVRQFGYLPHQPTEVKPPPQPSAIKQPIIVPNQPFSNVIKETPPKLVSLSPNQSASTQNASKSPSPVLPPPVPIVDEIVTKPVETITSAPSPVIMQTPKEEPKVEPKKEVQQLAIEKVTEELNLTLTKEIDVVKEEPAVATADNVKQEPEVKPKVEVECKPQITPAAVEDKPKIIENSIPEPEIQPDNSTMKEEVKAELTENKDDKDEYWSAKEMNIDSVIKTLCSADELSDHGSEIGKEEWFDEEKTEKSENSSKTGEFEDTAVRGGRKRGRGRKCRGGPDRSSTIQTRRTKVLKEAGTPSKRGGRGGGRPRSERKSSKSESETTSGDVYEFKDDSDENNAKGRPRLILTIKSPAASTSANAPTQPACKEPVKETSPSVPCEQKEEFLSPKVRKSMRIKERDGLRNTVDDTIEDVVKNTVVTRSVTNQKRVIKQASTTVVPKPAENPRKSPRGGRRKDRRSSEQSDDSSLVDHKIDTKSESDGTEHLEEVKDKSREQLPATTQQQPQQASTQQQLKQQQLQQQPSTISHPGWKELVLRRVKGDMQEPMTLIDPVTGLLTPMRECEEGRYIPLPKQAAIPIDHQQHPQQPKTVIEQPRAKPPTLKAHVLSSPVAKAVVAQQQQQQHQIPQSVPGPLTSAQILKKPNVIVNQPPQMSMQHHVMVAKPPQHSPLNINVSVPSYVSQHLSPRPGVPNMLDRKGMPMVPKPQQMSPNPMLNKQQVLQQQQQQQKPPTMMAAQSMINTQVAHMKPQQMNAKTMAMNNKLRQQIMTSSPPGQAARLMGKMEPPKIDVGLPPNVMLGQRPQISPQGPRHAGLPAYEASLGDAMAHFPPGAVPLRPPHDLPPAHYMHPANMMPPYPFLRQTYHLPRSPMVSGGLEKPGDGQEGEEAPVTSPPLELRRPGSVGLALSGRTAVVPHSLHSPHGPHDRTTDSPQVGQIYNMHTAQMQHYHSSSRYYDQTEPPPAHRPVTSHGSLTALTNDRSASHLASLGAPERGHLQPDRPLSSHSALAAHMGAMGEMPLASPHTHLPDRPLAMGAAGNILGAVARHVGVDAPTSQRGVQAATPPHASQVPPQAESLLMLLKQYPCMWQGLLALKNDQAAVQMYFVSGNDNVAKCSLPKNNDGSTPPLRIFQRMRLEPSQVEGVARKMQMENEHCMLLALPCGHDHMDVLKQSTNLTHGFITYLQQKQAAGIVNVAAPGTTHPAAFVVHIFPSCDFVNENLRRIAPSLLERVADIAHLLIVITTV